MDGHSDAELEAGSRGKIYFFYSGEMAITVELTGEAGYVHVHSRGCATATDYVNTRMSEDGAIAYVRGAVGSEKIVGAVYCIEELHDTLESQEWYVRAKITALWKQLGRQMARQGLDVMLRMVIRQNDTI